MVKIKQQFIKPQYFILIAVVTGAVAVGALRYNNQQMIKLREAVYVADKNNTDIQKPLNDLRLFVTSHMNTNLSSGPNAPYPPIQLKYTYERLVAANGQAITAANNKIYSEAQKLCEQQNPNDFSGKNRVPCIEAYVKSRKAEQPPVISDSLYKFSFLSPRWSPDLAGWSLVVFCLSILLFFGSLISSKLKK